MPHNRDASHDIPPAAPPSAEVLGEAARRVASAYPDAVRPPADRRRVPAVAAARHPGRRHGPRQDPPGHRRPARGRAGRPVPRRLPGRRQAHLGARDPRGRADADVHVVDGSREWRSGHRWTVVNYDLLGDSRPPSVTCPGPASSSTRRTTSRTAAQRTTHVLRLAGRRPGSRRPVTDPEAVYLLTGTPMTTGRATCSTCCGRSATRLAKLLQLREAVLRGVQQRLRAGHPRRVERRGAGLRSSPA